MAMAIKKIEQLPLYPEDRSCVHPTAEQILRLYSHVQCHSLFEKDSIVQTFRTDFTPLQEQILELLEVDPEIYQQVI